MVAAGSSRQARSLAERAQRVGKRPRLPAQLHRRDRRALRHSHRRAGARAGNPKSLYREIMNTDGLTQEQRQAVIEAVERTLATERGGAPPAAPSVRPERERPASLSAALPAPVRLFPALARLSSASVPTRAPRRGSSRLRPQRG